MLRSFHIFNQSLNELPNKKTLINTINAHCYNMTLSDPFYRQALENSDVLIPDGISVVWAVRWLTGQRLKKIAGADLFFYELQRLQQTGGKCFFLGSTNNTLNKIKETLRTDFPNVQVEVFSPAYKPEFSPEENLEMIHVINKFCPDVLMIGMTAPKQEKWAYQHYDQLHVGHICCIGAVFDFYAGTINRAPAWMIKLGLEWFYRLYKEPKRMWKRYLIGNALFIFYIIREKISV